MTERETYAPGPAAGASIDKQGERWTLVVVRELNHPPARVWQALTDPAQLREWAPFDADHDMSRVGPVQLSTVGAPAPMVSETSITRAEPPKLLEYDWSGQTMRWQLEPLAAGGTRLTLWHAIDRRYIAMGAAGWHICFDVLDRHLGGAPIGRMVGMETMKFGGWQRLLAEYTQQFGLATPRA